MSPSDDARTLLARLRARGVEVQADEHRVHYRPKGAMTPELAAEVRRHKADLLALLSEERARLEQDREDRAARLAAQAITRAVTPRLLPVVLDAVATADPDLLHEQERRGIAAGEAMDAFVAGDLDEAELKKALDHWSDLLQRIARRHEAKFGVVMGRAPIWAFWRCFTAPGQPPTRLTIYLFETVGYPDEGRNDT